MVEAVNDEVVDVEYVDEGLAAGAGAEGVVVVVTSTYDAGTRPSL